jgi:hypothetical protein
MPPAKVWDGRTDGNEFAWETEMKRTLGFIVISRSKKQRRFQKIIISRRQLRANVAHGVYINKTPTNTRRGALCSRGWRPETRTALSLLFKYLEDPSSYRLRHTQVVHRHLPNIPIKDQDKKPFDECHSRCYPSTLGMNIREDLTISRLVCKSPLEDLMYKSLDLPVDGDTRRPDYRKTTS